MNELEKALKDLAEAIGKLEAVERIKIQIKLVKPKPDKAKQPETK